MKKERAWAEDEKGKKVGRSGSHSKSVLPVSCSYIYLFFSEEYGVGPLSCRGANDPFPL